MNRPCDGTQSWMGYQLFLRGTMRGVFHSKMFLSMCIGGVAILLIGGVTALVELRPEQSLVDRLLKRKSQSGISALIDYDYPLHMKRLWIIAARDGIKHDGRTYRRGDVILNTWTSHAFRSGFFTPRYFSNTPESFLSSRGFMKTVKKTHSSPKHGTPALKVHGLEAKLSSLFPVHYFPQELLPVESRLLSSPSTSQSTNYSPTCGRFHRLCPQIKPKGREESTQG